MCSSSRLRERKLRERQFPCVQYSAHAHVALVPIRPRQDDRLCMHIP